MSIKVMARVWEYSQAEGTALLLMLALGDFCDDEGICYPGVDRLSKKCRVSPRTVQRLMIELEGIGELIREHGAGLEVAGERGVGRTTRYRLNLGKGRQNDGAILERGDIQGGIGVTKTPERGDTATSPKPSGEPSGEPSEDEVVPRDELLKRLGDAFRLTAREMHSLNLGGEDCRVMHQLQLTYGTLWRLEKLWKIPNGDKRKNVAIYHSTTLSHFVREPDKDISRARDLFPPSRSKPPVVPKPDAEPLPIPTDDELDAMHRERYRSLVRAGLKQGVDRATADNPDLAIPPRPR